MKRRKLIALELGNKVAHVTRYETKYDVVYGLTCYTRGVTTPGITAETTTLGDAIRVVVDFIEPTQPGTATAIVDIMRAAQNELGDI